MAITREHSNNSDIVARATWRRGVPPFLTLARGIILTNSAVNQRETRRKSTRASQLGNIRRFRADLRATVVNMSKKKRSGSRARGGHSLRLRIFGGVSDKRVTGWDKGERGWGGEKIDEPFGTRRDKFSVLLAAAGKSSRKLFGRNDPTTRRCAQKGQTLR